MIKKLIIILVFMGIVISSASYMTGYITFGNIDNPFSTLSGDMTVSISITTDTEIYHSGEYMEASISTASNKNLNSAIIKLYGIQNKIGSYEINEEQIVEIRAPGTETVFLATMPRCYGCAGVEPGQYELTAEIIYNNEIIASTTKVLELVK
jgi:hypothetical protein